MSVWGRGFLNILSRNSLTKMCQSTMKKFLDEDTGEVNPISPLLSESGFAVLRGSWVSFYGWAFCVLGLWV